MGGFGVGFINWYYSKEEVSAITFWPTVNLGYRLSWNFGLSVAPYVGGNYGIGIAHPIVFLFIILVQS